MADQVQVELLRPLNGQEIGTKVEYDKADAERLEACGAVRIVKSAPAPQNKMEPAPRNKSAKGKK